MENIATRLKKIRIELGNMTQAEFAKPLGITGAHISKIERGKTIPSGSLIKLMCKEYGINEAWLVDGKEPITIDELEEIVDEKMIQSTQTISKMLRTDDLELRLTVAKLNSLFADILDIGRINDKISLEYLELCEQLLKNINKYFETLKVFSIEGIVSPDSLNTQMLFEKYNTPIAHDLKSIQNFIINSKQKNNGEL